MLGFAEGLVLKEGDSHIVEFASLPYAGPSPHSDAAYLGVTLAPSASNDTRVLRLELFPESLTNTPFTSIIQLRPSSTGQLSVTAVWLSGSDSLWPERRGFARITMVSREVEIVGLTVKHIHNGSLYSRFIPVPEIPPRLSIFKVSGEFLQVSWPATAPGYKLQYETNPISPSWHYVTNAVINEGENFSVMIQNNSAHSSFRLYKE